MSGLVLVFDLDDTLYPERQFALSGFTAAGRWAAAELGIAGLAADMTRLLDGGHLGALFKHRAGREAARPHARSILPACSRPIATTSRSWSCSTTPSGRSAISPARPSSG